MSSPVKKAQVLEEAFLKVLKPASSTIDMSKSQEFHLANEKAAHKWPASDVAKYVAAAMELPQYAQMFESNSISGVKFITYPTEDDLIYALGMLPANVNIFHFKKMFSHVTKLRTKVLSSHAEKLPTRFVTWGTGHIAGWLEYVKRCPSCANALLLSKLTGKEITSVVTVEDMEILLQGSASEEFQKALDALTPYCYTPPNVDGFDKGAVDDLIESLEKSGQGETPASLEKQMVLRTEIVDDEAEAAPAGGASSGKGIVKKKKKKGKASARSTKAGLLRADGEDKKETAIGRRLRLEKEEAEAARKAQGSTALRQVPPPTDIEDAPAPVSVSPSRPRAEVHVPRVENTAPAAEEGNKQLRKSITFNPTELTSPTPASDSEIDAPPKSILKHSEDESTGLIQPPPKRLSKKRVKAEKEPHAESNAAASRAAAANTAALNAQLAVEALTQQIDQERRQFQTKLDEMERVVAAQQQSVQTLRKEVNKKDGTLLEATQVFEQARGEAALKHSERELALGQMVQDLAVDAKRDRTAAMGLLSTAVELNEAVAASATTPVPVAPTAPVSAHSPQYAPVTVTARTSVPRTPAAVVAPSVPSPTALRESTLGVAKSSPSGGNSPAVLVVPQMTPLMPELSEEPPPAHAPETAAVLDPPMPTSSPITLPETPGVLGTGHHHTVSFAPEHAASSALAVPEQVSGAPTLQLSATAPAALLHSSDRPPQTPPSQTPPVAPSPASSNSATKLREITSAAAAVAGASAPRGPMGTTRYRAAAHPIMRAIAAYEQTHPEETAHGGAHGTYSGDLSGVLAECSRELAGWTGLLEKYRNSKAVKLTNSISDYQLLRVSNLWCELGMTLIDDHLCDAGVDDEDVYMAKARQTLFGCAARLTAELDIPTPPPASTQTGRTRKPRPSNSLWASKPGGEWTDDNSGNASRGGKRFVLTATELRPVSPARDESPAALTLADGLPDLEEGEGATRVNKCAMAAAVVFLLGIVRKMLTKYAELDSMQLMHVMRQLDPAQGPGSHVHTTGTHTQTRGHSTTHLSSTTTSAATGALGLGEGRAMTLPVQELGRDDLRHLIEQTLNVSYKGWEQFDAICQKIDVQSRGFITLEQVTQCFVGLHPLNAALMQPAAGLGLEPHAGMPAPERLYHCCKVASIPAHCVLYVFSLLTAFTAIPVGADGADVKAEKAQAHAASLARAAATAEQTVVEGENAQPPIKTAPTRVASYTSNQGHITALLLELMMNNSSRVSSFRRYLNKAAKDAAAATAAAAAAERAAKAEAAMTLSSAGASQTNSTASMPAPGPETPKREVRIVYTNYSEEDEGYIENVGLVTDLMHLILSEFLHNERDSASSIQSYCAYMLSLAKKGTRGGHGRTSAAASVPIDSLFVSSLIYLLQPAQLRSTCHAIAKELQIYFYGRPGGEEVHPLQSFILLLLTFTSFGEACHNINAAAGAVPTAAASVGTGWGARATTQTQTPEAAMSSVVALASEHEYMLATLLGLPVPVCYRSGHAHTTSEQGACAFALDKHETSFPLVLTPIQVTINLHINKSVPEYIGAYVAARGLSASGRTSSPERDGELDGPEHTRSPIGSPNRRKGKHAGTGASSVGIIQGVNDLMQTQRVQQISTYLEHCTANALKKKKLLKFVLSLLAAIQKQTAVGANRGTSISELMRTAGVGQVAGQSTRELVEMARRVQGSLIEELKEQARVRGGGGTAGGGAGTGSDTKLQQLAARIDSYRGAYAKGLIRESVDSTEGQDTREIFSQLHDNHSDRFRIGDALQEITTVKESVRVATEDIIRVVDSIMQLATVPAGTEKL